MDSLPLEDSVKEISGVVNAQAGKLHVVREEEEESLSLSETQGHKRQRDEDNAEEITEARKKRAVEGVNGVGRETTSMELEAPESAPHAEEQAQIKPQSNRASKLNTMDTDQSFLLAVASRKKSKRNAEDTFDREFNNLRISKPDPNRLQDATNNANYWEGHDDFLNDINVRGNFMRIVEMEVKERIKRNEKRRGGRSDWDGREDFKKFKKVRISIAYLELRPTTPFA